MHKVFLYACCDFSTYLTHSFIHTSFLLIFSYLPLFPLLFLPFSPFPLFPSLLLSPYFPTAQPLSIFLLSYSLLSPFLLSSFSFLPLPFLFLSFLSLFLTGMGLVTVNALSERLILLTWIGYRDSL